MHNVMKAHKQKIVPAAMDDEPCYKRTDQTHCRCWWDGDACCACGAPAMSEDQKMTQGMIEEDERCPLAGVEES